MLGTDEGTIDIVGVIVGRCEYEIVGSSDDSFDGTVDIIKLGISEGIEDRAIVGYRLCIWLGLEVGCLLGIELTSDVGKVLGMELGCDVGKELCFWLGCSDG